MWVTRSRFPSAVQAGWHRGAAGIDTEVWRLASANVSNTIIAALLIIVTHVIAAVGLVLCFVGLYFTTVYAYGVTAGIVDWYRRVQTREAPVGPSFAGCGKLRRPG